MGRLADLGPRAASGAVLGIFVLGFTYLGGLAFSLFVLAAGLLSIREWVRLVSARPSRLARELSYGMLLAVVVIQLFSEPVIGFALFAALGIALHLLLKATRTDHRRLLALGVPYIGIAMTAMLWLRDQPEIGLGLVVWLLVVVWATDIGGYMAGRAIGGPKLAPKLSPKKTWAGLGGAVIAAALLGAAAATMLGIARPWMAAPLAGILAVVAQLGDLFESSLKRRVGAKDSGRLIPGHGGVLDRIDGLIAAAPVMALAYPMLPGSAA